MTDCQRCAGTLQYTIATYTGSGDLLGTITKHCEPCIAHARHALELEAETLCRQAAVQHLETQISAARQAATKLAGNILRGILLILCGLVPWLLLFGIGYTIYHLVRNLL